MKWWRIHIIIQLLLLTIFINICIMLLFFLFSIAVKFFIGLKGMFWFLSCWHYCHPPCQPAPSVKGKKVKEQMVINPLPVSCFMWKMCFHCKVSHVFLPNEKLIHLKQAKKKFILEDFSQHLPFQSSIFSPFNTAKCAKKVDASVVTDTFFFSAVFPSSVLHLSPPLICILSLLLLHERDTHSVESQGSSKLLHPSLLSVSNRRLEEHAVYYQTLINCLQM